MIATPMSSFKDLLVGAGFQATETVDTPKEDAPPEAPEEMAFAPKMVVRRTKKGRGGRWVTLITGITSGQGLVLSRLKKEMGVGGREEEDGIVIQGDNVERVARWLESQGAKKVVRS